MEFRIIKLKSYEEFLGYSSSKWQHIGIKYTENEYCELVKKDIFKMKKSYLKYCKYKKIIEMNNQIAIIDEKLKYQFSEYGEYDPIDLSEREYLLSSYLKLIKE